VTAENSDGLRPCKLNQESGHMIFDIRYALYPQLSRVQRALWIKLPETSDGSQYPSWIRRITREGFLKKNVMRIVKSQFWQNFKISVVDL